MKTCPPQKNWFSLASKTLLALSFLAAGTGSCLGELAETPAPAGYPQDRVSVVSPEYRSTIKGNTKIDIRAPGLAKFVATCWTKGGEYGMDSKITPEPVALAADGAGSFVFSADQFPHGPLNVRIQGMQSNGKVLDDAYLQLFNAGGINWDAGLKNVPVPAAADGMALTYADDFDKMPTISRTGGGATYCSLKPDGSEFGDAVFADHEGPYDPFYQIETYLRIRLTYRPDLVDPNNWKRKCTTGFLSSEREDGTGFHTKGGHNQYFECRMLYGAAPGTWPAFWTLTTNNHVGSQGPCDELDILEAYMPWVNSYHITPHEWSYNGGKAKGEHVPDVTKIAGKSNVCQTFHTYACLIKENATSYYFDNVLVYTHPTLKYSWSEGNYFMINLAFQDRQDAYTNGDVRRYAGADDLWVDWVRVYEEK